jgi:hypothetical protein
LLILISVFTLFLSQVSQGSAEFQQLSVGSKFEYNLQNMYIREQYNKSWMSCPDLFIPFSEIGLGRISLEVEQDNLSENESLPSYLEFYPDNRNVSLLINRSSNVISGFTYTDQWVGFLDSMNKSVGKNLYTSLSTEDFNKDSCILSGISSLIFPLLQTMYSLPILASGDFNYYNSLLDKYPFGNSPDIVNESAIKNISNQDILGMRFDTNYFTELSNGDDHIDFWFRSYLLADINLNTKTIAHFNFFIREEYVLENISRDILIRLDFTDQKFFYYYNEILFGFKSNLATLFLIALVTLIIRNRRKIKQIW